MEIIIFLKKKYKDLSIIRIILAFIVLIPNFWFIWDIYKSENDQSFFESLLYFAPFFAGVGMLLTCILIKPKNDAEQVILSIFGVIIFLILLFVVFVALAWTNAMSGF